MAKIEFNRPPRPSRPYVATRMVDIGVTEELIFGRNDALHATGRENAFEKLDQSGKRSKLSPIPITVEASGVS